jgi:hypothetical protein
LLPERLVLRPVNPGGPDKGKFRFITKIRRCQGRINGFPDIGNGRFQANSLVIGSSAAAPANFLASGIHHYRAGLTTATVYPDKNLCHAPVYSLC